MSLQKVQGYDYWNPLLWEFYFLDNQEISFFVKTSTLSFIQFESEVYNTGHKYLTGYTPEEEFSIEFLETNDFKVLDYLKEWQDLIFDKNKRVFRNGDHTKNGLLLLQKFVGNESFVNALNRKVVYETEKAFDFKNMLILGIDTIDLDYTTGEGKVITARFTADSVDEGSISDIGPGGNALTGPLEAL